MGLSNIIRVFTVLVIGCSLGCSQATEEQCDKAFDHYFDLKEHGIPPMIRKVNAVEFEERRPRFLSQCVGHVKPAVITCWLSAETLEQLTECEVNNPMLR